MDCETAPLTNTFAPQPTLGLSPPTGKGLGPLIGFALAGLAAVALAAVLGWRFAPAPSAYAPQPAGAVFEAPPLAAPLAPHSIQHPPPASRPGLPKTLGGAPSRAPVILPAVTGPAPNQPEPQPASSDLETAVALASLESAILEALPHGAVRARRVEQSLLLTGQVATPAEVAALEVMAKAAFPTDRLLNLVRPSTLDQEAVAIRVVQTTRPGPESLEMRQGPSEVAANGLERLLRRPEATALLTSRLTAADGRTAKVSLVLEQPALVGPADGDELAAATLHLRATTLDIAVTPTRTTEGQVHLQVSIGVNQSGPSRGSVPAQPVTFVGEALLEPGQAMTIAGLTTPAASDTGATAEPAPTFTVTIDPEPISADLEPT